MTDRTRSEEDLNKIYQDLTAATSEERTSLVLRLLEEHPEGRLQLPARDGVRAVLNEVDLSAQALQAHGARSEEVARWVSPQSRGVDLRLADLRRASLRLANLRHADLREAVLQEAVLAEADLEAALLDHADLSRADLAGVNLRGADAGGATCAGAMLEDASLQEASLRFVDFTEAILVSADLQRADLWGATLEGADLEQANLCGATLNEANLHHADLLRANLGDAVLGGANLKGANLKGANLQGASVRAADFEGAILQEARLQDVDLSHSRITHVHISGAWLEKTRFRQNQLGGAIGEELTGQYENARLGYLALERNFDAIGDPDAASWAYRKKRRMQKLEARRRGGVAVSQRKWRTAIGSYSAYARDQLVEWVCDYGESIPRVLWTIFAVWMLFAFVYGATGSILLVGESPDGVLKEITRAPLDAMVFSLLAMTTAESATLVPANMAVDFIRGIEALLGVALTGLLGFVVGNRIRR